MYQPLARKYRPQTFADLVGQDTTTEILTRAIALHREPHALILSGIRGVGKTSFARLYAKALNCEQGPTAIPCSTCESCRLIARGAHEDVGEIDGASNNGVDEVRRLQETLHYIPQRSRFKIYIIDEVHMLSLSAFNALLKSLEEPPAHVVFIFATTELGKLPDTVLGRCQVFHLRKLDTHTIRLRLEEILKREGINYEAPGLFHLARAGKGSMRDAITLLDQTIALGSGAVTQGAVTALLPNVSLLSHFALLQALLRKEGQVCIEVLQEMQDRGGDFLPFLEELLRQIRNGFLLQAMPVSTPEATMAQLGCNEEEYQHTQELVERAAPLELNRLFRSLLRCRGDLDGSDLDRYVVENYCLEWCLDPGFPSIESLRKTGDVLSTPRSATHSPTQPAPESTPPTTTSAPMAPTARPAASTAPSGPQGFPSSWRELIEAWKKEQPLQARKLEEVYVLEYSPQLISVTVAPTSMIASALMQKDVQKRIEAQFRDRFAFMGTFTASLQPTTTSPVESLLESKQKEKVQERIQIENTSRNHPFVKEIESRLQGTIQRIDIDI